MTPLPRRTLAIVIALAFSSPAPGERVRFRIPLPPAGEAITHTEVRDDGALTIELTPHSVRAPHHRVLLDDGVTIVETDGAPPRTLRGIIHTTLDPRLDGAPVAASRLDDGLHGIALGTDGSIFELRPDGGGFLAFVPEEEQEPTGFAAQCDASGQAPPLSEAATGASILGQRAVEVALEIDYLITSTLGSPAAALADMESVVNAVALIYDEQLDLGIQLVATVIQIQPVYTAATAPELIQQVQARWTSTYPQVHRDIVHLATFFYYLPYLGVASGVGGVCSSLHYSWSGGAWLTLPTRTQVMAHEYGHLLGAHHCNTTPDCGIMCATIGGCDSVDQFGPAASGQITAVLANVPCLHVPPGPVTPPFTETFPAKKPAASAWSTTAKTKADAVGEPSPKRAIRLRGALLDRILTSHQFDLHFMADPWLTFREQARGVEPGEALVVERLDAAGAWVELGRVVADGVTRDVFTRHAFPVSGLAGTDDLNVRLRVAVSDKGDRWYLDDVRVDEKVALVGDLPRLGERRGALVNRGDPTDDLPWTMSADPGSPWLTPATTSGALLAGESGLPIEFTVDPSGLPEGLHVGSIIVTNTAVSDDSLRVPVSVVVTADPTFLPGDRLEASLDGAAGRTHAASFAGAPGEKLVLSLEKEKGLVGPTVSVFGPDGAELASFPFASFKKKKTKKKVTLTTPGIHRVVIVESADAAGAVALLTARKLPKNGKPFDGKAKPAPADGAVTVDVALLFGARLSVTAAPFGALPSTFALDVYDPSGEPLDVAPWIDSLAQGGVTLQELPIATPGLHRVVVREIVGAGPIALAIDTGAPAAGAGVVEMSDSE